MKERSRYQAMIVEREKILVEIFRPLFSQACQNAVRLSYLQDS